MILPKIHRNGLQNRLKTIPDTHIDGRCYSMKFLIAGLLIVWPNGTYAGVNEEGQTYKHYSREDQLHN